MRAGALDDSNKKSGHGSYGNVGTSSMEDKYKWCFFKMFSSILTHAFLFQHGIYLGISISSCDCSTPIQMMMNDDKTYLYSQLIAVTF